MRIFYTTDVHGSDRCFRKFLNAAEHYGADVLILGGDITGKAIIPFRRQDDGSYQVRYMGEELRVSGDEPARELEQKVSNIGYYPYRCDASEAEALAGDPARRDRLFVDLIVERVARWAALAQERLGDSGIPCLINAGNDDPIEIDAVLQDNAYVEFLEGRVVELADGTEVASCGYANRTPWNCPRDTDEADLESRYEAVAAEVRDPERAVFNFHCPPYNTGIDQGPRLDEAMRMQTGPGGTEMQPVGTTAGRRVIESYQPLLGLHGHLHESRGTHKVGRTLCINPGSEYSEGILHGAVIDLKKGKVKNHILTIG